MTRGIIIVLCILVVGYGLFEARRLVEGPVITITAPANGSATSSPLITVQGVAENVSFLTVDDKTVSADTSGHFSVTLSPPAGYTIITVAALDRFGRRTRKSVSITILNYCPLHVGWRTVENIFRKLFITI
jgi:hypothetical protein